MIKSQGSVVEVGSEEELEAGKYRSPARVLIRSFRMSRDNWREKHHEVQAKLEQERQLSCERGESRERWRNDFEVAHAKAVVAELLAQQRLEELEQARVRISELEADLKKT